MKVLLEEYKKNEKLPGRIRDIIAETLNTSPTQIARMDAISNNLTPDFQEELKEEKLNMSTAYELSGLAEEKQKEIFEEYIEKGSLTIKEVKQKKEDVENIPDELDKLNGEVTEKLAKEYGELAEQYESVSGQATEYPDEEIEEVEITTSYNEEYKANRAETKDRGLPGAIHAEDVLRLVEKLIAEHKEKVKIDLDITVDSQEKGYRYALEDVRDEIKAMITISKMK